MTGVTIVYTGSGKGKTTAAFGLALRMLGRGWRVLILQFLKGPLDSGERIAASRLAPDLVVRTLGQGYVFLKDGKPSPSDLASARAAWSEALKAIGEGPWDAVVLDEVNCMTSLGLLPAEDLLQFIKTRPKSMTLVLTGRDADPLVCRAADIVTDMSCIRHLFNTGVADIEGIDR